MTEAVTVSPVDVQRARLLVRLNRSLGAASPAYVIKIAEAQPSSASTNGDVPPAAEPDPPAPVD